MLNSGLAAPTTPNRQMVHDNSPLEARLTDNFEGAIHTTVGRCLHDLRCRNSRYPQHTGAVRATFPSRLSTTQCFDLTQVGFNPKRDDGVEDFATAGFVMARNV